MIAPRGLLAVLATAALAAPTAAHAQGAGDDQYQDPFADHYQIGRYTPT